MALLIDHLRVRVLWNIAAQILLLLQMALQPGVGLGLRYNMPPGLSVPCSISPFVYPHLSQVHGHVIQPSHSWSSSCCIQLSVQHLFLGNAVSCILSICPSHLILWHLINLTMFSPLIMASNSSFRRTLHNSFSFTGPYIFRKIFLSNLYWFSYSNLSSCRKVSQNAKLIIMRKSLMCSCLQECSTTNRFHKYTAPFYCSSGRFLWLPRKCAVIIKYVLVRTQISFSGQTMSETGTVTDFLHEDVRWVCPQECRLTLTITPAGS